MNGGRVKGIFKFVLDRAARQSYMRAPFICLCLVPVLIQGGQAVKIWSSR